MHFATKPEPLPPVDPEKQTGAAPGEVLVQVRACGRNFADLPMNDGRYQDRPALPFLPGLECAGIVAGIGAGTKGPAIGIRVLAYTGGGALAEAICLPVKRLLPIPDTMGFEQAAGFPVAYGTSHLALDHRAHLQPGEKLLVTGASGAVGLTAVELGKRIGARVVAMARGDVKLAIARAAGADRVLDSDTPDLKAVLKSMGGTDVVQDTIGTPPLTPHCGPCAPKAAIWLSALPAGTSRLSLPTCWWSKTCR